jgi:hypothetical protein
MIITLIPWILLHENLLHCKFPLCRGAKKKPYLTVEQFVNFLNKEQRDPRLNEILYPYYTVRQAQDIINEYEFRQSMANKGTYFFFTC